jgi:hypothetical protein
MRLSELFGTQHFSQLPFLVENQTALEEEVLDEVQWHERSPLYDILMQNRRRFIHFSRVPKLGVNPKKGHLDPHGIYFYPVNWILTYAENKGFVDQFALDMPYYFLADIDLSTNGYLMSKMTMKDVETIARENGWYQDLYNRLRDGTVFKEYPAKAMWKVLAHRRNDNRSDHFALRGVDYIYDDGTGTIHPNEPSQILVLNPRIIHNVTMGENRDVSMRATHSGNPIEEFEVWKKAMADILKTVQNEFGGVIKWNQVKDANNTKKNPQTKSRSIAMPSLYFNTQDCRYTLFFTKDYNLYLERKYMRRIDTVKVRGRENLSDLSVAEYATHVRSLVQKFEQEKIELKFQPAKPIDDVVKTIKDGLLSHPSEPEVEVNNETKKVYINGEVKMPFGMTFHYLGLIPDIDSGVVTYNISLRTKNHTLLVWASDMTNVGKSVAQNFRARLDGPVKEMIGPKADVSYRYGKFYYEDEWNAFLGWLVINSGVSANGIMEIVFKDEIAAYHAFSNKKALLNTIKQIVETF